MDVRKGHTSAIAGLDSTVIIVLTVQRWSLPTRPRVEVQVRSSADRPLYGLGRLSPSSISIRPLHVVDCMIKIHTLTVAVEEEIYTRFLGSMTRDFCVAFTDLAMLNDKSSS